MSLLDIFSSRKKRPRPSSGSTGDTNHSYMESLVTRLLPTSISQRFSSLKSSPPGNGSAATAELTDSSEDEPDPRPPSKRKLFNSPESQLNQCSRPEPSTSNENIDLLNSHSVLYSSIQTTPGRSTYMRDIKVTPTLYSVADDLNVKVGSHDVDRDITYKSPHIALSSTLTTTRKSIFESTSKTKTEEQLSSNWLNDNNPRFSPTLYGSPFYSSPTTHRGGSLSSYIDKHELKQKSYMESLVTRLLPTSIRKRFSSLKTSLPGNGSAATADFSDSSEDEPDPIPPSKRKRFNSPESQLTQCSQSEPSPAETTDTTNHNVMYNSIHTKPGKSTYTKDVKTAPSLYSTIADESNVDATSRDTIDKDNKYKAAHTSSASTSGQSIAANRKSIYESAVKPKFEDKKPKSSEQMNSSWLNDNTPRFRPSLYGSPFYPGPTNYGGASASSINYFDKPNIVQRKTIKVKEPQATPTMTPAAKKLLDILENFSSPLQDARRIPVIQKRNYMVNRLQPKPEPKPSLLKTYKYEFNTPSYATLLRVKQRIVNTSQAALQIDASHSSSVPTEQSSSIDPVNSESSRPVEREITSKHKVRLTRANRGEDPLTMPEPVQLPTAVLHIDKDNLPKFSITPSIATGTISQSTSNFKIPTSDNSNQPLAVASSSSSTAVESEEKDWKCDNCWIKNKSSVKKCAACGGSKPGATEPAAVPLVVKSSEEEWKCDNCWIKNKSSVKKCAACGGSKPGTADPAEPAPPPRSSSPIYKPDEKMTEFLRLQKAKWECSFCLIRNEPDKSRCQCCDMEREGPSKEITPKPFKFPKESNISLKFGFDPKEQEKNIAKKTEEIQPHASINFEKPQTISNTTFGGFTLNKAEKKLEENPDNKKNEVEKSDNKDSVVPDVPKAAFTFGIPKIVTEKQSFPAMPSGETAKVTQNPPQETTKFTFGAGFLTPPKQATEPKNFPSFLHSSTPLNVEPKQSITVSIASAPPNKSEPNNEEKSEKTAFSFADTNQKKAFSFGSFTGSQSGVRTEFSFGAANPSVPAATMSSAPVAVAPAPAAPVPSFSSTQLPALSQTSALPSLFGNNSSANSTGPAEAASSLFTMKTDSNANTTLTATFSFGATNNNTPFGSTDNTGNKSSPFGSANNIENKVSPFGATNNNDNKVSPFGSTNNNENKQSPFGSGFKPGGATGFPMSAPASRTENIESSNTGNMPVMAGAGPTSWGVKTDSTFGNNAGGATPATAPFSFSAMSTESGPTTLFGAQPQPATGQMLFGGGLFGNTSQPSQPSQSANIFGQTGTNVFGAQSQSSGFGGTNQSVFGTAQTQISGFGTPAPSQPSCAFGVPAQSPPFGTPVPSQSAAFGAPTMSQPPAFGAPAQNQLPAFGSPAPNQTSAFGTPVQNQLPAFGASTQSQPSAFGTPIPSQPPAFGSPSQSQASAFGTPTPSQPAAFGAPNQNQPSAFGSSATNQPPAFCAPASSQPPAFGGLAQSQHSGFGVSPQSQSSAFGAPTQSQPPAFGAAAQPQLGDFNFSSGSRVFKFGDQQAPSASVYNFAGANSMGGMGGMMAQPMDGGMAAGGAQFSLGTSATSGRRVRKAVRRTQR